MGGGGWANLDRNIYKLVLLGLALRGNNWLDRKKPDSPHCLKRDGERWREIWRERGRGEERGGEIWREGGRGEARGGERGCE